MEKIDAPMPRWLGPGLLLAALALAGLFAAGTLAGKLAAAAAVAGALALGAFHFPVVLPLLLLAVVPFNYGFIMAGASIKLSEGVAGLMLAIILARAMAGDAALFARARRTGLVLAALTLLAALAVITAIPHPNLFNVRYEVECYIGCAYAFLFFRRSWWGPLLWIALAALLTESAAALAIKFIYGKSGISFFGLSGPEVIAFSAEDLASLAGGSFRLSGTMGHKNMLAAFFVLLLPLVSLEMLHRGKMHWGLVLLPSLITLALTDSMTGWGATLLIVVLTLAYLRRFDYLALLVLLVLPVAAIGIYKFGGSIFERIQQLFGSSEGWGTVSSRFDIARISSNLLHEYPWMGIGRNNFHDYGRTYYNHAHNVFVMKAIEMGIPAGLAFAAVIVALMTRTWQAITRQAARLGAQQQYYRTLGLWLGCLGFLAMNMLDYNYAHFSLGPLFMLFLGILLAIAMDLEDAEKSSECEL